MATLPPPWLAWHSCLLLPSSPRFLFRYSRRIDLGKASLMDEEEIKTEILQFAVMLAQKIGPDEAAAWLEWLALDVEDLVGFDGQ